MKDDTNITDFTAYRLEHLRNRRTDLGESMPIRQIEHLHNLRLQLDRRNPNAIKQRNYYQHVPKHLGGYNKTGKLPATINNLLRRLVDETDPGMLLSIEYYQLSKYFQESFRAVKDKLDDYET
jgi:hypothetical protein